MGAHRPVNPITPACRRYLPNLAERPDQYLTARPRPGVATGRAEPQRAEPLPRRLPRGEHTRGRIRGWIHDRPHAPFPVRASTPAKLRLSPVKGHKPRVSAPRGGRALRLRNACGTTDVFPKTSGIGGTSGVLLRLPLAVRSALVSMTWRPLATTRLGLARREGDVECLVAPRGCLRVIEL